MRFRSGRLWIFAILLVVPVAPRAGSRPAEYGKVEIIRDSWGIPHIFSDTDAGAMYGLGYATAEERGFQMTYALRIMQGRLAEAVGERPHNTRRETALDNDRKMRTFGWARAAARAAENLDASTLELLRAYSEGVNDSFTEQQRANRLHPLFREFGMQPDEWTPADCLLSWWHLGQFFATDGTRDLISWRNRMNPPPGRPEAPRPSARWIDDSTAVVQRGDVSEDWIHRVEEFFAKTGLTPDRAPDADGPKFSHAWVVGGSRTGTGAAALVSDPQTPVRNPSLLMEFHISGRTFNARGVGVPGSPGLLIGFNRNVAWGVTALGADQADLFRLQTDGDHPNQYRWDGKWRDMEVRRETIKVRGRPDIPLVIRETHLGPVVSAFAFRVAGEPEVALKRVPIFDPGQETSRALFAMLRAADAGEFARAVEGWRFPSANCLYGDSKGQVGYSLMAAIPVRSSTAPDRTGGGALPGTGDADDWKGFVPADLLPRVFNPQAGLLFSANHRPVGSFYTIPLGISTGSMGDTIRSWRLREKLSRTGRITPEDVLEVHYDSVNPARRDIVRLGLHLRDNGQEGLSEAAQQALKVLEPWLQAGASSDLTSAGAALATRISTFFRFVATPLALVYGGGESGLARFLKDAVGRIQKDPRAALSEDERRFLDGVLADAWQQGSSRSGGERRAAAASTPLPVQKLGWFDSLDGFGSLGQAGDISASGITCLDGQTIHSQAAQSYTQWVPLQDVDAAQSICPIGHSDRLDSPYRTSTMQLWAEGKLHPAPLSRAAIDKIAAERKILRGDASRKE